MYILYCDFFITASEEQIDKAKEIIKKLTFNFRSDDFENPGSLELNRVF